MTVKPVNKFLFLDVDGVLNVNGKHFDKDLKKECIGNLKSICDSYPDLVIVIVSQWRLRDDMFSYLKDKFKAAGITNKIDSTGLIELFRRGKEVLEHLFGVPQPYKYVIIDDEPDYYAFDRLRLGRLLITDKASGLTPEIAASVINELS